MTNNLQEINQRFRKVGEFILRFRWLLIAALIALDLFGFWGVTQMKVQSSFDSWFLEGDPLTVITDEFEEIFGNNEYVAILVEADDVFSPGILKMMRELGKELVSQLLLLYEMSGGAEAEKWLDYDYTMLNLMVEVERFKAQEVEREINYIKGLAKELFPDVKADMVGVFVQFAVIQNYIVQGQIISFLIALGVIAILMIVAFRSVTAGLIGLIPNLAPVIIVGGFMGYTGIPLDMITMIIVPMLLGISVDDSIHFVNHVKLEVTRTGSYNEGILHTFKTVGKALFMTTVILVATFSMYTTSIAQFFVNMGVLVSLGLTSALLADYLITPILIRWSKPFGEEKSSEFSLQAEKTVKKNIFIIANR